MSINEYNILIENNESNINRLKEKLNQVNSSIVAMQHSFTDLYVEKDYLEACINNPSVDNLAVLNDYNKKKAEYIEKLAKAIWL
jgi:hypothetical protein